MLRLALISKQLLFGATKLVCSNLCLGCLLDSLELAGRMTLLLLRFTNEARTTTLLIGRTSALPTSPRTLLLTQSLRCLGRKLLILPG